MEKRTLLQTAIERSVSKLVDQISEHVYDFTNIYIRRQKIDLDPEQLKTTLAIVKTAIKDGFYSKLDMFNADISKAMDEYTNEKSPLTGKK